jgi:hypothetical protein
VLLVVALLLLLAVVVASGHLECNGSSDSGGLSPIDIK